jgi:hypothetical protein
VPNNRLQTILIIQHHPKMKIAIPLHHKLAHISCWVKQDAVFNPLSHAL